MEATETDMRSAQKMLEDYRVREGAVKNALNECGIGEDVNDRICKASEAAAEFCSKLQSGIIGQATHDYMVNVPCGVMTHWEATPEHAIKSGVASACGALVEWDINAAIELCAEILHDVNAHTEAEKLLEMRITA